MSAPNRSSSLVAVIPNTPSSFTTGPAGSGYGLASVTLRIWVNSLSASLTLDVAVHRDSNGVPGQRLFALDNPPQHQLLVQWHDIVRFRRSTGYQADCQHDLLGRGRYHQRHVPYLSLTAGDTELSGKQPGWSIGDNSRIHCPGRTPVGSLTASPAFR